LRKAVGSERVGATSRLRKAVGSERVGALPFEGRKLVSRR